MTIVDLLLRMATIVSIVVQIQSHDFFVLGLTSLLTHLGHIKTVPACYRGCDNHFIVLTEISHRSRRISRPITLFWQRVNQFLVFLCRALDKGTSTCNWKLWFDPVGDRTRNFQDTDRMLYHQATGSGQYLSNNILYFLITETWHGNMVGNNRSSFVRNSQIRNMAWEHGRK